MAKVYLSGPMTGLPQLNKPAFDAAAEFLRGEGHVVFNPAEVSLPGSSWADYMRVDIIAMLSCEAVYLLPGWEKSRGARLEHHIANELGMRVLLLGE